MDIPGGSDGKASAYHEKRWTGRNKLESRLPGEISITSDMQMTPPLWQKVKRNFFMDESESGECKSWLKAQHSETSWEIDGETVETVSDFIFLGSKITADGDCSHEIKRCLLLGRKVMTILDSILKSRDITLPTKVSSSQGYGFSCGHVWM